MEIEFVSNPKEIEYPNVGDIVVFDGYSSYPCLVVCLNVDGQGYVLVDMNDGYQMFGSAKDSITELMNDAGRGWVVMKNSKLEVM